MRKADRAGTGNRPTVIVKKEEIVEGEGHGGAWKVAYADFVTAMMAFFLLMWLLNATTEDQRKGLADYFSPNNVMSHASSGTGQPFGGHTAFDQGALVSDRGAVQVLVGSRPTTNDPSDPDGQPFEPDRDGAGDGKDQAASQQATPSDTPPMPVPATGVAPLVTSTDLPPGTVPPRPVPPNTAVAAQPNSPAGKETLAAQPRAPTEAEMLAAQQRHEKAEFAQAAQQIRDAVHNDPALAGLARQLAIDITPEGLRIQILDADRQPMFPFGSATPNDRARLLLQKVTPVLAKLSQEISIAGYTDSAPFPGPDRTNWELSAERANATRRLLVEGGLPDSRIRSVTGNADRDPLLPADPLAAANRRIAIVVLRATQPAASAPAASDAAIDAAPEAAGRTAGGAASAATGAAPGAAASGAARSAGGTRGTATDRAAGATPGGAGGKPPSAATGNAVAAPAGVTAPGR